MTDEQVTRIVSAIELASQYIGFLIVCLIFATTCAGLSR